MPVVRFLGKTPKRVTRPIPLLSHSQQRDEIVFDPTAEVTEEEANYLTTNGGLYQLESESNGEQKLSSYSPARYADGKWYSAEDAEDYLSKMTVPARVRRLGLVWKIELLTSCEEDHGS